MCSHTNPNSVNLPFFLTVIVFFLFYAPVSASEITTEKTFVAYEVSEINDDDPEIAAAEYQKGKDAYKKGDYAQAIVHLEKAKQAISKSNAPIQYYLVLSLHKTQQFEKAITELEVFKSVADPKKHKKWFDALSEVEKELSGINVPVNPTNPNTTPTNSNTGDSDANAWKSANSTNTTEAYRVYLRNYPQGAYVQLAEKAIEGLDRTSYESAVREGTVEAFEYYLTIYTNGQFRDQALSKLKQQQEKDAWQEATSTNSVDAYYEYLSAYPDGQYAENAKTNIETMDNQAYQSAIGSGELDALYNYLENFSRGKYRNEVRAKISEIDDEDAWETAQLSNSFSSYERYLDMYPNGYYSDDARTKMQEIDAAAYNNAATTGTQSALRNYLNSYANGAYRSEVTQKLEDRIEYDSYMKGVNSTHIEDYENYIEDYPRGKYADEVHRIISNGYVQLGDEAFKSKDYETAKYYYGKYQSKYSDGIDIKTVNKQMKKIDNRESLTSAGYFMVHYDTQSPVGISFGKLNKRVVSGYFGIKFDPDIITGLKAEYEIKNNGVSPDGPAGLITTGEAKFGNASARLGLHLKLAYPSKQFGMWMYLGGGYIYKRTYLEATVGVFGDDEWYKSTKTVHNGYPEGGFTFRLANKLLLQYGLSYDIDDSQINHAVGLGVGF